MRACALAEEQTRALESAGSDATCPRGKYGIFYALYGKILLPPLTAPAEPAGLVNTLWSVKVNVGALRLASVETPT